MVIDNDLLSILVCPETKSPLVLDENSLVSKHPEVRRRYRIDDGIPVMLIDESEVLSKEEWEAIMKKHNAL